MTNYSDHTKPQFDITENLPEVYQSELNQSMFNTAFNRHLTKDDTQRVAGFVGDVNLSALVDRQIKEVTPHRQTYQLAPTMYTKTGAQEKALSFKSFQEQLTLMGVDINQYPTWGSTLQFNWVPPVNIDMLVNYQNYYWSSLDQTQQPQYFTIENRCNKAQSKTIAYQNILTQRGSVFAIDSVDIAANSFVLNTKLDDLLVAGLTFYTTNSTNVNVQNKYWTVVSSSYDTTLNQSTVVVVEPIAIRSTTAPTASYLGQWWYNITNHILSAWSGISWIPTSSALLADVSLVELLSVYQAEMNCVCNQSVGWDIGQWDDNQIGLVVWNTTLLSNISYGTDGAWMVNAALLDAQLPLPPGSPLAVLNLPWLQLGLPANLVLWYDTSTDTLKQSSNDGVTQTWVQVAGNFSSILAATTGTSFWDYSTTCSPQTVTQWSAQNQWVHKSEVQSFAHAHRAQLPILEYDSGLELNEWVIDTSSWKYRAFSGSAFVATTGVPSRFELEPIKSFVVQNVGGLWKIYLFDNSQDVIRDTDYTGTFVPGYVFRITDDVLTSDVYTVSASEYRETTSTDPVEVQSQYMVTVVTIQEISYVSLVIGGGVNHTRIEPVVTSQGDTWRGYQLHWVLDTSTLNTAPASSQSWNLYRRRSLEDTMIVPVTTTQGTLYVGVAHQELTTQVIIAAGATILLDPSLVYSPSTPNQFALAGGNDLRVYLNGIRQYGTYVEITTTGTPTYTLIGYNAYTGITFQYVSGIAFNSALQQSDVVRIEVGSAAFSDMGRNAVPVRTIEDEAAFLASTATNAQPVYMSLSQYRQVEQVKTKVNQYPLFNVYDVISGEVVSSSNIFGFAEDPTYAVNSIVQLRIVQTSSGKEYLFTQHLIDADDGMLRGYRNNTMSSPATMTPQQWWYNPVTNKVKGWDGKAWTDHVMILVDGTYTQRIPVVSDVAPANLLTVDTAIWYNPIINKIYSRDVTVFPAAWVDLGVVIVGADPTLRTIWRHGLHNEQFVPQYIDTNFDPVPVGSPTGDWQLPDQWKYNPEHRNKKNVKLSELITHFSTILQNQSSVPGLVSGGAFTLTQSQFNYGVGGTIKEHNDGFDTLISAVNVENVSPVGVIEFAQNEYASGLLVIGELFSKYVTSLLAPYATDDILNQTSNIANSIIVQYSSSDYPAQLYGDSSAYNTTTTKQGIENWISTIPMFKLGQKHSPHLNIGSNFIEVFHHDGHRSQVVLSAAEADFISRSVVALADGRSSIGKLGVISSAVPPATNVAFQTAFGTATPHSMLPGTYWYRTASGTRTLYRFAPYAITNIVPTMYLNGVELPDGAAYYNTANDTVYKKVGLAWNPVTTPGSGDITPLWTPVDLKLMLANVYLEVEQRLYDVTPSTETLVFDYATLPASPDYTAQLYNRFLSFVAETDVVAPLTNTTYVITDPFTWNYTASISITPPKGGTPPLAASCWQEVYTRWFGTPYPHLEPWKLQGYGDKPVWWDSEYLDTTGSRRWIYNHSTLTGMWQNIRVGQVPSGRTYPNGDVSTGDSFIDGVVLPTYNYFSVNISNGVIVGGYAPDQLLPPYYDNSAIVSTLPTVRSLFTNYSIEIVAPDADYTFGSGGPAEWKWTTSIRYTYDLPVIAFLTQPAKFLHVAFGPQYSSVDGLQVETLFNKVYAHQLAMFHGDIYSTDQTYYVRGLNQWYVNYNRFAGFDLNTQFRTQWASWTPLLTYQFGGIIDTGSFEISNKNFAVGDQDYNIVLANTGVIKDLWADAFEVSVLSIPPAIRQYNNQSLWKLAVSTLSPLPRTIEYYGTKTYEFLADSSADTIHLMRYNIVDVVPTSHTFYVTGNQTRRVSQTTHITVTNSLANDGTYTVSSTIYDTASNVTRIIVDETINTPTISGYIELSEVSATWVTGEQVVLYSTQILPAPLQSDIPYYVIHISNNTYKLAETLSDAQSGIWVDIISSGSGDLGIAEVATSFSVFGGTGFSKEVWYHYALDQTEIRSLDLPATVVGMQEFINIVDGYDAVQTDRGLLVGLSEGGDFDPNTGRSLNWQLEVERLIDWAYGIRSTSVVISDKYSVSVDIAANTLTFVDSTIPHWASGTQISVVSTGALPDPLLAGSTYFVQQTSTVGVFQLSITCTVGDPSMIVDLTTIGSGIVYVSLYNKQNVFPSIEINPIRNNLWIDTPQGVLANVTAGPTFNTSNHQLIFDQYGRPMSSSKFTVYREDKRSRVSIRPQIPNDAIPAYVNDPYNYIHFGGAHFFVEGYEHYVLFNPYTASGDLIYDAFDGLNTKRFNVDYLEKKDYSLRPTLGGYYLSNQKFKRNMEGAAGDMKMYYDILGLSEMSDTAQHAHALIGYQGREPSLDLLNVNLKSQFLFYRGEIQSKGSVNSVNAYINDRRFVDAQMDEFWAWKVAEFGDIHTRVYPEIKLFATDSKLDDIRLEFLADTELETDPEIAADILQNFQPVSFRDSSRWNNFPEQQSDLVSPLFLDAEMSSMYVIYSGPTATEPNAKNVADNGLQYWFNTTTDQINVWNGATWIPDTSGKLHKVGSNIYWTHDGICDTVRVVRHNLATTVTSPFIDFNNYSVTTFIEGTGVDEYTRTNAEITKFQVGGFNNIIIIFTVNAAKRAINPAKLVDTVAETVISNIPLWHPAMGYHYDVALHNIDLQLGSDPATYTVTIDPNNITLRAWNSHEVGKTWLDTSWLGYLPYYDDVIMPNVNDRLYAWGKLAPWADAKVYTWVKSSVSPTDYAALVLTQSKDSTILQNDRASGIAHQTLFKRTRLDDTIDFTTLPWAKQPILHEKFYGAYDIVTPTLTFQTPSSWSVGDVADIYVNGVWVATITTTDGITLTTTLSVTEHDIVDVVRPIYTPTPAELAYIPALNDGVISQWAQSYEYTTDVVSSGSTSTGIVDTTNYYFWVENSTSRDVLDNTSLSPFEVELQLKDIPTPYFVVQKPMDDPTLISKYGYGLMQYGGVYSLGQLADQFLSVPVLYRQAIIRHASNYVTDDNRFIIRFTRDFTLRDDQLADGNQMNLKDKHEKWFLFREKQQNTVPVELWNRLTEATIGYKLSTDSASIITTDTLSVGSGYLVGTYSDVTLLGGTGSGAVATIVVSAMPPLPAPPTSSVVSLVVITSAGTGYTVGDVLSVPTGQVGGTGSGLSIRVTAVTGTGDLVRVPSLARELYDASTGSYSRFGLGVDQAFVDKNLAVNTVVSYLQNPANDFYPMDINTFFVTNNFDTPAAIEAAMLSIYNTFPANHVNAIWFSTLQDALTTKPKYKELMKTSWIALHGIRVLEVGGLFDD